VGTKLNRIPDRHELARMRERWEREDRDDVPLKDFETTQVEAIEGTINQLGIFAQRSGRTVEARNTELEAFRQLTAEVKRQGIVIAQLVEKLNQKAAKSTVRQIGADLAAKHVRAVDNLFKLVAVIGTIIGALIAYKGHS
jgi:hypothetical protein